jgi:pimeloyl-ACP methyl ester carboxylesterase
VCRENAPFTTPAEIAAEAEKVLPGFPAAVLAIEPQFGLIMEDCPIWDVPAGDPAMNEPVTSDIPVLLMAGTFDAITQPFLADSAAETLTEGRVVRFPAISHDVYAESECGRSIVADFLVRPDSYETSCVEAMEIPQFIH